MSFIGDRMELGYFPLQDWAAEYDDTPIGRRLSIAGMRVVHAGYPATGQQPAEGSVLKYGQEGGFGTIGDIHPWMFWQTEAKAKRSNGSWAQAYAAMVTDTEVMYRTAQVHPLRDAEYRSDPRYKAQQARMPEAFPQLAAGSMVIAMPATEESQQHLLTMWADPRLIAPSNEGPGECGTLVCDLSPEGEICMGDAYAPGIGGRHARLQTLVRVVRGSTTQSIGSMGAVGNILATNYAATLQEGLPSFGAVWGRVDVSGPITPGGGSSGPITPGGGGGPTTGPRVLRGQPSNEGSEDHLGLDRTSQVMRTELDGQAHRGETSIGFGSWQSPWNRTGSEDGKTPREFGSATVERADSYGVAMMAALGGGGPIHLGNRGDKHRHGTDGDGHPVNAAHISTNALYYADSRKDAPLEFSTIPYPNAGVFPLPSKVWLSYDQNSQHGWSGGSQQGLWRWWTTVPFFDPQDQPPTTTPPGDNPNGPGWRGGGGGGGRGGGPPPDKKKKKKRKNGPGGPATGGPGAPATPGPGNPAAPAPGPGGGPPTGGGYGPGPWGIPTWWPGGFPNPFGGPTTPGGGAPTPPGPSGNAPGPAKPPGLPVPITPGGTRPGTSSGKNYPNNGEPNTDPNDPGQDPNDPGGQGLCSQPQDQPALPGQGDADADARWFQASRGLGGITAPFGDLHGSGRGGTHNVDPRTQLGRLSGWDPWTHQRSTSNGIVESVGGERDVRSIYAIHHPFHTSFAGLSFRPQIYRQGYPNIERNPQMPESMLRADERERPHVLSMHAWGAQSEATGDWSHVEAPRDSRPRGGTGNGGVMFHPPRFEMADYFGINSAVDVEDTTSSKATQHYVLAGPNVAFALGKPKVNGGLQPGAVTIGRGTTTTRPLVVNYDSAELLSGYQNGSEVVLELAQGGSTAIRLPYGTNAQRPATPSRGMARINTSGAADVLEWWNPATSAWVSGGGVGAGTVDWYESTTLKSTRSAVQFDASGAITVQVQDIPASSRAQVIIKLDQTSLTSIAPLSPSADKLAYYTSSTTASTTDLTSFGRSLIDDADAAAARTTLGLASVASTASASDITTGTLGIARIPTGTTSSTVCIGNDSRLSDDRTANGLRTDTTIVEISSSPAPTAGQVLVATSDISAKWDTLASGGSSIAFADAPMSNTAINVTTYTALVSKSVTVTAGDSFEIEAYGTLLNNSGGTRTYRFQIALGTLTCEAIDGTTVAASGSNRVTFKVKGVFGVASTSNAGATLFLERNVPAAANTANSIATTTLRYSFQTSSSNLTGSQTLELRARSDSTTATQTLSVFAWSIRQVAQQL